MQLLVFNSLAAEFSCYLRIGMEIIFTYLHLDFYFPYLLFGTDFFLGYSYFPGCELKLCPYLTYRVSVYTQFLKRRTRKLNFCSYVLNLV